jgi:hypothetical protein
MQTNTERPDWWLFPDAAVQAMTALLQAGAQSGSQECRAALQYLDENLCLRPTDERPKSSRT